MEGYFIKINKKRAAFHHIGILFSISLLVFLFNTYLLNISSHYSSFHHTANQSVFIKNEAVVINSPSEMGEAIVAIHEKTVKIKGNNSINKIIDKQPEKDKKLKAELIFYDGGLFKINEKDLILYSSAGNGKSWQAHLNSKNGLAVLSHNRFCAKKFPKSVVGKC